MTRWALRGMGAFAFGILAVGVAPGCGDAGEAPEELGDAELAADGCGAGLELGKRAQVCTYQAALDFPPASTGWWKTDLDDAVLTSAECVNDAELKCSYKMKGVCVWLAGAASQCVKQPDCPAPASAPTQPTTSRTIKLETGSTLCDPPKSAYELEKKCTSTIMRAPLEKELGDACTAQTAPQLTHEVSCCVPSTSGTGGTSSSASSATASSSVATTGSGSGGAGVGSMTPETDLSGLGAAGGTGAW